MSRAPGRCISRTRPAASACLLAASILGAGAALAQEQAAPPPAQTSDLALQKQTQNPVADLISVPLQSNLNFGYGAKDAPQSSSTQYVLNIQPVIPITLGDTGFNLITRPILPILEQPDLVEGGQTWGWGDIQVQSYLSPASGKGLIWGVGPVLQMPTASDPDKLGSQKWSAGPGAVALVMPGKWVFGALANQIWSFAGDSDREDISLTTVQPFINYNFERGWYVTTSPSVTANWEADGNDNTWTVPLGGGFGRLIRLGKLPVNLQAQTYYNVVKPEDDPAADWTLRLQVQFLFPK